MIELAKFLWAYPLWVKLFVCFGLAIIAIVLAVVRPRNAPSNAKTSPANQNTGSGIQLIDSPGAVILHADGNINIGRLASSDDKMPGSTATVPKAVEQIDTPDLPSSNFKILTPVAEVRSADGDIDTSDLPPAIKKISALTVEVRLTCTAVTDAERPPGEVAFWPVGDSHAYLEGSPRVRLDFVSPVRFHESDGQHIRVTNRFVLSNSSALFNQPVMALKGYGRLSVPIVTVVWGKSLARMKRLEVSMTVNGQDVWYQTWNYDVPFEQGPRFAVGLDELHKRLQ